MKDKKPAPKKPNKEKIEPMTMSDLQMEQLKAAQKEAREFKEKYLHSLAELENTRKRLQKEKGEMTKFAAENIILEFLTPIDNFENALSFTDQMNDETKNWAMGFKMLMNQFKDVLSTHGVESFSSEGKQFDTDIHEAVEVEETNDIAEGTIVKEFLCGYKRGDRILRAARVKVAKKPKTEEPAPEKV
ncbi:MAG: nucleotide exchange factor GrpE [Rhabdochlamydiaceae bacterium]|nr:nucleotide exchange factor GrpE [Candidatus Amphrikana amoebophyrae]